MSDANSGDHSYEAVLDKVIEAIAEQKEHPREMITAESKFEDLGVDSLDAMEILFKLEEELDVDIPNDAARAMRDVGQVVEGLQKLLAGEELVVPDAEVAAAEANANANEAESATSESAKVDP